MLNTLDEEGLSRMSFGEIVCWDIFVLILVWFYVINRHTQMKKEIEMPEQAKKTAPPYATFKSFTNFLNKLREGVVPDRIDPSVFGNASGSVSYSTINTLKYFGLIDEEGVPSEEFRALVDASDEERKPILSGLLKTGYQSLWSNGNDLRTMSAKQFDDQIRAEFDVQASTIDKIAAFFIAAAKYAEIPISPHLSSRTPIASSSSSRKSSKQRKQSSVPPTTTVSTPPTPQYHPFIEGLLKTLPQEGAVWPPEERRKWLTLAENSFDLIYRTDEQPTDQIEETATHEE